MAQARLFLSFILLLAVSFVGTGEAEAQRNTGWTLCNQTSFIIEAATARPIGQSVVVEGWTKLRPGACEVAVKGPLVTDVHFVYARSSNAHRGGARNWGGDQPLCVDTTSSFSVESPPDCAAMGLDEREFRPVLIERSSNWLTNLRETETYDMDRARQAGVQRLLKDADVYTGRIDGDIGRRTRAAIRAFLKEQGLSEKPMTQTSSTFWNKLRLRAHQTDIVFPAASLRSGHSLAAHIAPEQRSGTIDDHLKALIPNPAAQRALDPCGWIGPDGRVGRPFVL